MNLLSGSHHSLDVAVHHYLGSVSASSLRLVFSVRVSIYNLYPGYLQILPSSLCASEYIEH